MKGFDERAGREFEVPPMVPSIQLKGQTYRMAAYNRPALAYLFLQDMMGEDKFREAMQYYIAVWKGKHPNPFDFFNIMSSFYGEDLSWYFKSWFFNWDYPDLKLKFEGGTEYTVQNPGRLPLPVKIYLAEGTFKKLVYYQPASIWKDGKTTIKVELETPDKMTWYQLGDENIPDVNRLDNVLK
ncbi:MAG: hypothetical protein IPN18_17670 [Ignavibacteriales bacterium]|nr:hypothetical protein [Ignavibacteriales bacterium]